MRRHLLDCIEKEEMRFFPSIHFRKPKPPKTESLKVYCSCRPPYHGETVVECSECKEWYHVACVGIARKYLVDPSLDWICTKCA